MWVYEYMPMIAVGVGILVGAAIGLLLGEWLYDRARYGRRRR